MELTEEERAILRQAGAIISRNRSPDVSRKNGRLSEGRPKGTGKPMSEETKAKMRAAQAARREREKEGQAGNENQ